MLIVQDNPTVVHDELRTVRGRTDLQWQVHGIYVVDFQSEAVFLIIVAHAETPLEFFIDKFNRTCCRFNEISESLKQNLSKNVKKGRKSAGNFLMLENQKKKDTYPLQI